MVFADLANADIHSQQLASQILHSDIMCSRGQSIDFELGEGTRMRVKLVDIDVAGRVRLSWLPWKDALAFLGHE